MSRYIDTILQAIDGHPYLSSVEKQMLRRRIEMRLTREELDLIIGQSAYIEPAPDEPKPTLRTTYKRADGEPIADFAWVTDIEYVDDEEDAIEIIQEHWTRTSVTTFWHFPPISSQWCRYDIDETDQCEEDADEWVVVDGTPISLCAKHAQEVNAEVQDPAVPDVAGRDI